MKAFNKRKQSCQFKLGKRVSFTSISGVTWPVKKKNGKTSIKVTEAKYNYKGIFDRIILKQNHLR